MRSTFKTSEKTYELKTDPLCCNRFGLAEFLAEHADMISDPLPQDVLDVGCGAGPLGIYFADRFGCHVVGVELNPVACNCCRENIRSLHLSDRFLLYQDDFQRFGSNSQESYFDLIVSNPPIDSNVSKEIIQHFAGHSFQVMDSDSFVYLTNSWHCEENIDLLDLIFLYGKRHLRPQGKIVIVFCMIDCEDPGFVTEKAKRYHFDCTQVFQGVITPESIGAESAVSGNIDSYIMCFEDGKGNGDQSQTGI